MRTNRTVGNGDRWLVVRGCALLAVRLCLGTIILLASVSKISDLRLFHERLYLMGLFSPTITGVLTFAVPALELTLAWALLFDYQRRSTFAFATGLMLAFLLVAIYEATAHPETGCSCFSGRIEHHPTAGWPWVVRNALLSAMSLWAWKNTLYDNES